MGIVFALLCDGFFKLGIVSEHVVFIFILVELGVFLGEIDGWHCCLLINSGSSAWPCLG